MKTLREEDKSAILGRGTHAGFDWMIMHNQLGFRCGYVHIPPTHPWYKRGYDELGCDPDVHGGLTFAGPRLADDDWWLGFDCGHLGDAQDPTLPHTVQMPSFGCDQTVRTQEYVQRECEKLCALAQERATP